MHVDNNQLRSFISWDQTPFLDLYRYIYGLRLPLFSKSKKNWLRSQLSLYEKNRFVVRWSSTSSAHPSKNLSYLVMPHSSQDNFFFHWLTRSLGLSSSHHESSFPFCLVQFKFCTKLRQNSVHSWHWQSRRGRRRTPKPRLIKKPEFRAFCCLWPENQPAFPLHCPAALTHTQVIYRAKAGKKYFYLNSCSLTTSPRYSMMNCPALRGSLVRIPQPFSSARNRSRHCTHSCRWIRWLQHCSPHGHVLGEHSAKIILKNNLERVIIKKKINKEVKGRWVALVYIYETRKFRSVIGGNLDLW